MVEFIQQALYNIAGLFLIVAVFIPVIALLIGLLISIINDYIFRAVACFVGIFTYIGVLMTIIERLK